MTKKANSIAAQRKLVEDICRKIGGGSVDFLLKPCDLGTLTGYSTDTLGKWRNRLDEWRADSANNDMPAPVNRGPEYVLISGDNPEKGDVRYRYSAYQEWLDKLSPSPPTHAEPGDEQATPINTFTTFSGLSDFLAHALPGRPEQRHPFAFHANTGRPVDLALAIITDMPRERGDWLDLDTYIDLLTKAVAFEATLDVGDEIAAIIPVPPVGGNGGGTGL